MKKFLITVIIGGLLVGFIVSSAMMINKFLTKKPERIAVSNLQQQLATASKATIVSGINEIVSDIQRQEKVMGKLGPGGCKVYTPQETARLIKLYQALELRGNYLNSGDFSTDLNSWEGYTLSSQPHKTYQLSQIFATMAELKNNKVPLPFIANFRIFLLPDVIPNVSGLGGAGYSLLSAQANSADLITDQLAVTLYHEFGHHVNFSYMPKDTLRGKALWAKYLHLRGGKWHGPGSVNTAAWGESSEETFAEDFRMLFGTNQPYFGDLALGDPRSNSSRAKKEINFIRGLAKNKIATGYKSPWIPEDNIQFWQVQGQLVAALWLLLGLGMAVIAGQSGSAKYFRLLKPNISTKY